MSEAIAAELKIKAVIGFDGTIINGIRMHRDGQHLIYPLGNKIIIQNWTTKFQQFLTGHTNVISAIDLSRSGKYIASGQINHIGFKVLVIIWNYETRTIMGKHEVHKVRVECVAFSRNDTYMISLGGRDCSSIVVWDMKKNQPLCGTQASKGCQGEATTICVANRRDPCFVTAGEGTLIIWKIDYDARKLIGVDVNVSKLKRTVVCMVMDDKDEILYCGTSTGDILKIKPNYSHDAEILDVVNPPVMNGCFARYNENALLAQEKVELYSSGVRALLILTKGILLVGAGDGTLTMVQEIANPRIGHTPLKLPTTPQLKVLQSIHVHSMVTSLNRINKNTVLIGTVNCEIYSIDLKTFIITLLVTCHKSSIYAVAFPNKFSKVFATASKDDIRIWNMKTMQELVRIRVTNFSCSSLAFAYHGKSIITGWDDGIIRVFTPLTGRLIYSILNAHNEGVSAIAVTEDDTLIISGGCEGQVRCWEVSPHQQRLICVLKEHKGPIVEIHINIFNDEAVTASGDGTCIIWDLVRKCTKNILFANTLFMSVRYYPTGVQILTSGSDRKVAYWEVCDGTLLREVEASTTAAINALDISPDGDLFITGGNDQLIKLWKYQEGVTTHIGNGHSAAISAVRFSPNGKYMVSTSASGSIFVWECPFQPTKDLPVEVPIVKSTPIRNKVYEENIMDSGTITQEKLKKKFPCECICSPKRSPAS